MSKILIIEDEEPIRRVLVRILSDEDSGFEIHEASDGKKGIDLIKKESFDLVLCDIKMPKIDGIELLQRTRKTNTSLPFIISILTSFISFSKPLIILPVPPIE